MEKEYLYILTIKRQLKETEWNFEKKKILKNAVDELRSRGHDDIVIRKLFQIEIIKEQDNSHMINNNNRYLDLLDEILAKKD